MAAEKNTDHPKTAGIIAEYNPFHSGHAYQIGTVRRISRADFVIALMSGDFVQRGAPALLDKYARARMALLGGADLVLELPCAAASGSAALFSQEAVRILDRLRVVDELWFGSEEGGSALFSLLSDLLVREPEPYRTALRCRLRSGDSYPLARRKALEQYLTGHEVALPGDRLRLFLEAPNNILGLEYCIALRRLKSSIRPCTLKRAGSGYHDLSADGPLSSASALRRVILSGKPEDVRGQMPEQVFREFMNLLPEEGCLQEDDFSLLLKCRLLECGPEDLSAFCPEDLARRILARRGRFLSFSQFSGLLKTRDRTESSIRRSLFRLLLGIPRRPGVSAGKGFSGSLPCRTLTDAGTVRILGFRRSAAPLLSAVKKAGGPVLEARPAALPAEEYRADLRASNLYEAVRSHKMNQAFREERTRQPVIL